MRVFKNITLALVVLCFVAAPAFAQTTGAPQAQYRTYPGGNIVYENPGQVYPPPGVVSAGQGYAPGYGAGSPGNVLPPAPMASAGAYQPSGQGGSQGVYSQASHPEAQYAPGYQAPAHAPSANTPQPDPQSGRFRPGVSLGAPNPHTNYIGDEEWKHFAQRTASFGGSAPEVVTAAPSPAAPKPAAQAKPKAKPKPKPAAKPKPAPKPEPVADIPKRPMNDQELEQFCLDYVELCKDYFK